MRHAGLLATLLLACAGCAHFPDEKVPPVRYGSAADVPRILRERAAAVRTVSATGTMTLTRGDGESVRLDVAMVSRKPDDLRLRAWKLGRAVFDLTLTYDGAWLFTPDDPSLKQRARAGGMDTAKLARSWRLLTGGFFDRQDLRLTRDYRAWIVEAPLDEMTVRCTVRSATLVPWIYTMTDTSGVERFRLVLDEYRMIGATPFPLRYNARSDSGTILIDLRDVELNADLAPNALVPPKRAEKLP